MIDGTNIILGNYQLLKNIRKNYNGIAPTLKYSMVGRRNLINSRKMDSAC